MATKDKHGLTKAWRKFCDEYRTNGANASKAYKKAYPKSTQKTCEVNGHKLLRKAEVSAYLEKKEAKAEKVADITQARIKQELAKIGFQNMRELFNEDGHLKPIHELPEQVTACIASVEMDVEIHEDKKGKKTPVQYIKRIKLWPKNNALELLGKNKKMFTDKFEGDIDHRFSFGMKK